MEIVKAKIETVSEEYFLTIEVGEGIKIPISTDNPNDVKSAFNTLVNELRKRSFVIELEDEGEDLFSQVAKEFLAQLNREMEEIYGEMVEYDLISGDGAVQS